MKITLTIVSPAHGGEFSIHFTPTVELDTPDLKVLWDFEQLINSKTSSRVHVNLEE